jgi:hypothetical protein
MVYLIKKKLANSKVFFLGWEQIASAEVFGENEEVQHNEIVL